MNFLKKTALIIAFGYGSSINSSYSLDFTVNSLGDGPVNSSSSLSTLRKVVEAMNNLSNDGTITPMNFATKLSTAYPNLAFTGSDLTNHRIIFSKAGKIEILDTINFAGTYTAEFDGGTIDTDQIKIAINGNKKIRLFKTANSGTTLIWKGIRFEHAFANEGGTPANGGAFLAASGTLTFIGCSFENNIAVAGGGIYTQTGTDLDVRGSTFMANRAPDPEVFDENNAEYVVENLGGGAISSGGKTRISGNLMGSPGVAFSTNLYNIQKSLTPTDKTGLLSYFFYNSSNKGGAIECRGDTLEVTNAEFLDNAAATLLNPEGLDSLGVPNNSLAFSSITTGGGAIFARNNCNVTVSLSNFQSNAAIGHGSAIYLLGAKANIKRSAFSFNSSYFNPWIAAAMGGRPWTDEEDKNGTVDTTVKLKWWGSQGGVVASLESQLVATQNSFVRNNSPAGALFVVGGTTVKIANNGIIENMSTIAEAISAKDKGDYPESSGNDFPGLDFGDPSRVDFMNGETPLETLVKHSGAASCMSLRNLSPSDQTMVIHNDCIDNRLGLAQVYSENSNMTFGNNLVTTKNDSIFAGPLACFADAAFTNSRGNAEFYPFMQVPSCTNVMIGGTGSKMLDSDYKVHTHTYGYEEWYKWSPPQYFVLYPNPGDPTIGPNFDASADAVNRYDQMCNERAKASVSHIPGSVTMESLMYKVEPLFVDSDNCGVFPSK